MTFWYYPTDFIKESLANQLLLNHPVIFRNSLICSARWCCRFCEKKSDSHYSFWIPIAKNSPNAGSLCYTVVNCCKRERNITFESVFRSTRLSTAVEYLSPAYTTWNLTNPQTLWRTYHSDRPIKTADWQVACCLYDAIQLRSTW